MIAANNPSLKSWVKVEEKSDFPIQNLPFGIFKTEKGHARVGVAIGAFVLDLEALAKAGFFDSLNIDKNVFSQEVLNPMIRLGKSTFSDIRARISNLLNIENKELQSNDTEVKNCLIPMAETQMLMPLKVENYTDFYSSMDHATNVGIMFRDPANALLPNWKHIPVGYHGRASSIRVSGTNFHRPKGQFKPADAEVPTFGPSKQLDFELEMGFVVAKDTELGDSVSTKDATDYIFGMVIFNDWSARDIQSWEYVPLGPFLGKNFASTISPWVVTLDALEPFRVKGPEQSPKVLPYLEYEGNNNIDINLEVYIQPEKMKAVRVSKSNYKFMYWNMNQQLAHHTINGCNIKVGDIYASGTISGPTPESFGSMLEICWKGTKPIHMENGSERKFIADNDTVIMKAYSEKDGVRVGFGECRAMVLAAK